MVTDILPRIGASSYPAFTGLSPAVRTGAAIADFYNARVWFSPATAALASKETIENHFSAAELSMVGRFDTLGDTITPLVTQPSLHYFLVQRNDECRISNPLWPRWMGLGMLAPDSSLQTKLPLRDTERWRFEDIPKYHTFHIFSDGGHLSPLRASNFVGRVCQRSVDRRQQSSITVPLVDASPLSGETPRCAPPPFPLNSHLARQPTTNWNQLLS